MSDQPPDRPNFAGLYRSTLAPLRRYLGRLLGNAAEAQDVAHDAYLRVYPKVQDNSAKNPQAVLYTTARRLAINKLKRRSIAPFVNTAANLETAASGTPGGVANADTAPSTLAVSLVTAAVRLSRAALIFFNC